MNNYAVIAWFGVCLTLAGLVGYNTRLLSRRGRSKYEEYEEFLEPENEKLENSKNQQHLQYHHQSDIQTSKSHVEPWLSCLKSIQTRQFDIFKPIFTDQGPEKAPILYIDPANHANFGDSLLSKGVFKFLAKLGYPKWNIEVCRVKQAHAHVPLCGNFSQYSKLGMKLAVWAPGGNWGDVYPSVQKARMLTFKDLLKNTGITVVSLPQSIHFGHPKRLDDDVRFLKKMIEESGVGMEVARERIILTWRQKNSYETAMANYGFVQNLLVPDMAFQVGPLLDQDRYPNSLVNDYRKKDIVFVMRSDTESIYSNYTNQTVIRKILDTLPGGKNTTFVFDDWPMIKHPNTYYQRVSAAVREKTQTELDFDFMEHEAMSYISLGKVLITDRLHGSIFGFLAYKPHVYLENSYKKVSLTRNVAFNSSGVCGDQSLMHYEAASGFEDALKKAILMVNDLF